MSDKERAEFKRLKDILVKHLTSKVISKPLILVTDNRNIKSRLEEVFKYDIQELSKYNDVVLFVNKYQKTRVFKICTNFEYLMLDKVIKENSEKI